MWRWLAIGSLTVAAFLGGALSRTPANIPTDTPVLVKSQHGITFQYATYACIMNRTAESGYVDELRWELMDNPFNWLERVEATTLSHARRLTHDRPATYKPDPLCAAAGGFVTRAPKYTFGLF